LNRFSIDNSIGDINNFVKGYDSEYNEIPKIIEDALNNEIQDHQSSLVKRQQSYETLKADIEIEINLKIQKLEEESQKAINKSKKSIFHKIFFYLKIRSLINKKLNLTKNTDKILKKKTRVAENDVINIQRKLEEKTNNKKKIISDRCSQSRNELASTKNVVDELYTLIAGAIGENSVVNELQKLSDNYYLINDFSVKFNPPIYNKKEKDRIFSIQIDHLLVCQSGVFLLETKNWSKQSINNLDFRSPVEQILRTSYALFVLLNSDSKFNDIKLERHHWGSKKIPIKTIIVMTNEKPKVDFKHVKVLSLKELNGYIKYFDETFSADEVKRIFDYLKYEMQ